MEDRFKYRAWDKEEHCYIPDGETNFCHGMMEYWLDKEDCPLVFEQCTGLKDKNGKLIYEGDIIRFSSRVYDLELSDCRAKVEFVHGYFNPVAKLKSDNIEIIGNIRENPELLEG